MSSDERNEHFERAQALFKRLVDGSVVTGDNRDAIKFGDDPKAIGDEIHVEVIKAGGVLADLRSCVPGFVGGFDMERVLDGYVAVNCAMQGQRYLDCLQDNTNKGSVFLDRPMQYDPTILPAEEIDRLGKDCDRMFREANIARSNAGDVVNLLGTMSSEGQIEFACEMVETYVRGSYLALARNAYLELDDPASSVAADTVLSYLSKVGWRGDIDSYLPEGAVARLMQQVAGGVDVLPDENWAALPPEERMDALLERYSRLNGRLQEVDGGSQAGPFPDEAAQQAAQERFAALPDDVRRVATGLMQDLAGTMEHIRELSSPPPGKDPGGRSR